MKITNSPEQKLIEALEEMLDRAEASKRHYDASGGWSLNSDRENFWYLAELSRFLQAELAELRKSLIWMYSHPHILRAEIIEDYLPILRKMIEKKNA